MIYQYAYNDNTVPCIHTGMNPRTFAQSTVTALMHETGYRINPDGSAHSFILDTTHCMTEHDREWIVIPLPFDDGTPLFPHDDERALVLPDSPIPITEKAVEDARRICRLFSYLITAVEKKIIPPEFLYAAVAAGEVCFLSSPDGALIVLPPQLILRCKNADMECTAFYTAHVHPEGQTAAMDAVAFFLAALVYRCLSGYTPFFTAHTHQPPRSASRLPYSAEAVIQSIQDAAFVPFKVLCPNSSTALADIIDSGLARASKRGCMPDTGSRTCDSGAAYQGMSHDPHFFDHAALHSAEAVVQQLCRFGTQNTPLITDTAVYTSHSVRIFIQKQQKKNTCRHFFRKYAGKLAAIAASTALLCTLCIFLVIKWYTPPEHAGKPAAEIVRLFYTAIASLEHGQLGRYVLGSAAELYEKPMLNLFFASTMRETFERKKPYYTPQEFLSLCKTVYAKLPVDSEKELLYRKGLTALKGGSVYGVSHLAITPVEETDTTAVFKVSFYYWLPIFPAETAEKLLNSTPEELAAYRLFPLQIILHRDTVYLTYSDNAWYIRTINIDQRQLEADSGEQLFDYFIEKKALPPYLQSANEPMTDY